MSNGMRSCAQGARGSDQFATLLEKNNKWSLTLRFQRSFLKLRALTPKLGLLFASFVYSPLTCSAYLYSPASYYWIAGNTTRFSSANAACQHAADVATEGAYIFHHVDHVLGGVVVEFETGRGRCMGIPTGTNSTPSMYSGLGRNYECAPPLYQLYYYDSRGVLQAICYTDKADAPKNDGGGCPSPIQSRLALVTNGF